MAGNSRIKANKHSKDAMIEVQVKKNGQADAPTSDSPALTTSKEWLMASLPKNNLKLVAKEFLYLSRVDYENATDARKRRAILARQYGLTYEEIGEELGISDTAARLLIKRAVS